MVDWLMKSRTVLITLITLGLVMGLTFGKTIIGMKCLKPRLLRRIQFISNTYLKTNKSNSKLILKSKSRIRSIM